MPFLTYITIHMFLHKKVSTICQHLWREDTVCVSAVNVGLAAEDARLFSRDIAHVDFLLFLFFYDWRNLIQRSIFKSIGSLAVKVLLPRW